MVLWFVAGLALLVAVMGVVAVRRVRRRLEALNQSYWELRYDFTRLRSQVARIDPGELDEEPGVPQAASQVTFVPLSSIKKKNG